MRPAGRNFVKKMAEEHNIPEPIYEFGSLQVPGQEVLANLRPLFPNKHYVGCDFRKGPGVDRIMDVEKIDLNNNSIGTVIIIDTLEHVRNVYAAINEIHRILKPCGLVIMASVMFFPIHNYPYDYWRFTPKAFELLLEKFEEKKVYFDGNPKFPTGIYGWGIK